MEDKKVLKKSKKWLLCISQMLLDLLRHFQLRKLNMVDAHVIL